MLVDLAYGKTGLQLEVPKERTTIIEPTYLPPLPDVVGAVKNAIRNPINAGSLKLSVRPDQTVTISVCDITRPMPSRVLLPILLNELSHVPDNQITILVATGTHRSNTDLELQSMLGENVTQRYRVINHNAFDLSSHTFMGKLPDGLPIWLDRRWVESDFRITTGFVEPHFFAGFSGGPKMVAPGLAAFETTMELHSANLIRDPKSTWGVTKNNPIHDAIRHIAKMTGVDFSVDVTINRNHLITSVFAGEISSVHKAACHVAKRTAMKEVPNDFDIVVTTNSGYPLDLNLYQTVKGMSAAAQIVRYGGTILCASECRDGIPDHGEYKQLLGSRDTPEELLEMIKTPGYNHHDQWQVQLQAQIQLLADVHLKSSYLTTEQVRAAHLKPIDDLQTTLNETIKELGATARVCVLPMGPQTIPYVRNRQ